MTVQNTKNPAPFAHNDIHLIPTQNPALIQQTWTNNKVEWGKGLDIETYHAREVVLANQEFTNNRKLQVWILVPRSFDPDHPDLDLILSAVETFDRPGIVASKSKGLEDVRTFSVASVFTPEKYRGYGYASLMMKSLWKEIEAMDARFTFLYSDVGPVFYGRIGWTPKDSNEIVIPVAHPLPTHSAVALEDVTDLGLPALIERDAQLLRESLGARMSHLEDSQMLAVVTPEPKSFFWLHARSRFVAKHVLKLVQPDISVLGAKTTVGDSFVLWFHDLASDQLYILRWRVDTNAESGTALALVGAALAEAKKWKVSKVVIWNPDQSLSDLLGLPIKYRESAIPSLGLCGPSAEATSVEWVMNEKYSWC